MHVDGRGTATRRDLRLPTWGFDVVFMGVITVVCVAATLFAVFCLCAGPEIPFSIAWLVLLPALMWLSSRDQGGIRRMLVIWFGVMLGRQFAEIAPGDSPDRDLRFGCALLGRRFLLQRIRLDKIASVEYGPGQGGLFGVTLWFGHDDSRRTEKEREWGSLHAGQDAYGLEPSTMRRERIEALLLSLVALLREAGVDLREASAVYPVRRVFVPVKAERGE